MAKPVLLEPHFHNEEAAYAFVEARLWPEGPVCPHCGATKEHVGKLAGKATRIGLYKCYACREQFTVKIGTIFEASHVPLRMWLQAIHLLCASKKGISTRQLQRMLKCGLKTAWFLGHRIREAMGVIDPEPLGGKGKTVEVDETFIGQPDYVFINGKGWQQKRGTATKRKVMSLVERGGAARSKVDDFSAQTIRKVLFENIVLDSTLNTDEAQHYKRPGQEFAAHEWVTHSSEEYARGETSTNTVEGFFSIFKRGMKGVYQHCSEQHLHRYLKEFDFRYSNRIALGVDDEARADRAIIGAKGKRLTYRTTH